MSGEQGNMGWWLASDGRWYPPEQHADYVGPPTATGTPAGSPATPPPFPWSPPDPSVWNAQPQGPSAGGQSQRDQQATEGKPGIDVVHFKSSTSAS